VSAADQIVLAGYLVRCPLGGYAWQALHFLIGLRALGLEPYFYEDTAYYGDCFDPLTGNMHVPPDAGVAFAADFFQQFGFGNRWVFWDAASDRHYGLSRRDTRTLLHEARAVITLAPVNRLTRHARQTKVFIDIDPAFTQIRAAAGDPALTELLTEHDIHFTIGENIGTPGCVIPTAPFTWRPTRQPIAVDLWSPLPPNARAAFTTIGRWDERRRDLEFQGQVYAWSKRTEWMRFLELPHRTGERFAVAMDVGATPGDSDLLSGHGWEITDPVAASRDALHYRDFIRQSKGEFTVAKDLNVRLRSGWFSDRSACYLAAGRPVVTQDTGFGCCLPTGKGLYAVRSLDEAVEAVDAIAADYAANAAAAHQLAAEYFDAGTVLAQILRAL
jgi:hypothetical protein